MKIKLDDLSDPRIEAFLAAHIDDMQAVSPPESKHALDMESLKAPNISFWTLWDDNELVGCGAVMQLSDEIGEIKSMRISETQRGKGYAQALLNQIIDFAKQSGLKRLSLETGSMDFFEPARKLYLKFGFDYCEPFGNYVKDDNSVFMTRQV
ncbi:GNAT family N-acetyltransferase [Ningiella sp. W23]|uniref:GNAT family N-acetyltransferase n=1 Tax=Ningiella sp. W23 TaxID=3023715 RepID=UPI0037578456